MGLLRFHWDFFGPDSSETAAHFLRHLDQFCASEGITGHTHWVTKEAARSIATMECDEQYLKPVRDALRPKRGERVLE